MGSESELGDVVASWLSSRVALTMNCRRPKQ